MKITCTKNNLKKALNLASKIIGSVSSLPILNNALLKAESGQLLISTTNLEMAVKAIVGGQIEESGQITVPVKTLADYINNLNEDKITLSTKGTDLFIKTPQTESVLKGLPAEEFPLIPEIKARYSISAGSKELAEALSQVVFATSFSETQPELSGVLFSFLEKELRLAATDRYRLAERRLNISADNPAEYKIIVPNRAVNELVRMIGEETGPIEISVAESQVLFRASSSELISRLIEGQYPDYQQIIPKDFMTTVTVKIDEFISAIKLSGLFVSNENNNIEMRADKEKNLLILKSTSQRFGSNKTEIPCDVQGQENEMIFNFRYLLDCLNHVNSPKVQLKLINSNAPAMIMAEGQDNYLYLVMPIKI